jgi:transposase-like protein
VPRRRRYSAKERAEATGIALVEGVTEAERQTGIPKQTIDYWTQMPEFGQLRTTAREVVADRFWAGIQVGLAEVVKGLKGDAPLKEKAHALGVMYDRHALLTGGATGRTESRDLSSRSDHERALLSDVIDAELARRLTDPEPAEDGAGTGEAGPISEVSG